jgi:uncharacterized protein (TIGR00730 family)
MDGAAGPGADNADRNDLRPDESRISVKSVCVFCGSSSGANPVYHALATALGREIASRGLSLIYGGGHVGLMGAVADAALDAGGDVIGFMPQSLVDREIAHKRLTAIHVTSSMHERKAEMERHADGFIALPGGFGTLDEFCEIVTWGFLGIHRKPIGILDANGFFAQLLGFFDHAMSEGFIRPDQRALILEEQEPTVLLDRMETWIPTLAPKWTSTPSRP